MSDRKKTTRDARQAEAHTYIHTYIHILFTAGPAGTAVYAIYPAIAWYSTPVPIECRRLHSWADLEYTLFNFDTLFEWAPSLRGTLLGAAQDKDGPVIYLVRDMAYQIVEPLKPNHTGRYFAYF